MVTEGQRSGNNSVKASWLVATGGTRVKDHLTQYEVRTRAHVPPPLLDDQLRPVQDALVDHEAEGRFVSHSLIPTDTSEPFTHGQTSVQSNLNTNVILSHF